jgi:1,4-alpha-glucan branching enzyme
MGAIPHADGVAFRVWAPNADRVFVMGTFNDWSETDAELRQQDDGYWFIDVHGCSVGDEYRYLIVNGEQCLSRIDPYAREVTNSVGNSVVYDPDFDWGDGTFERRAWNEMVIYEMHVGTFHRADEDTPGGFAEASEKFHHLEQLGVTAIQIMPIAEFAGDLSWGYNPAHIFAVESAYGGPKALRQFVKDAHSAGLAVILDVVYNHFGPSDLELWRFDGWSSDDGGGIYFYNDWRKESPWGATRPDYGRKEVRQFIRDNALMWLEDYRIDGLRFDMTLFIRSVRGDGDPEADLPDGWSLMADINREVSERFPGLLTIAEDLQNEALVTGDVEHGGAGFGAQWDAAFVHPVRAAVIASEDRDRSLEAIRDALSHCYNDEAFQRIVYSESHDEVANGKARVPQEISPDDSSNWAAQKRSTLAAALVLTSPGIPMLFQGQEFLQGDWFQDTVPLDWDQSNEYSGIVRLYRDLIRLRLNREGVSRGLCGQHLNIHHLDRANNLIAFHRWDEGGPGDDVIVVANFAEITHDAYQIGFPAEGTWKLRLNSDWHGYSQAFGDLASADVQAQSGETFDGYPGRGSFSIAPYSVLIYSMQVTPDA